MRAPSMRVAVRARRREGRARYARAHADALATGIAVQATRKSFESRRDKTSAFPSCPNDKIIS
jgi:hypothetical protein